MSPQYQQNLRQNLTLKIQLAQWAASEAQPTIYLKTLEDIQHWIIEYFDTDNEVNKRFLAEIIALKSELVVFSYPNSLASLKALRDLLAAKPLTKLPAEIEAIAPIENKDVIKVNTEQLTPKALPTKESQEENQTPNKPVEDSIKEDKGEDA